MRSEMERTAGKHNEIYVRWWHAFLCAVNNIFDVRKTTKMFGILVGSANSHGCTLFYLRWQKKETAYF